MNIQFVEQWLQNLKKYWYNKNIDKAVSLFNKTTFYQETPLKKYIICVPKASIIYFKPT